MGLHAVGVILVAALHLATPLPRHGPSSAGRANYYLVGSSSKNLQGNSVLGMNGRDEVLTGEVTHSRSKRSTVVQYHYVSEPRIPRFTYERVYQKLPEPEPEPTPPPLPSIQETRRVMTEESHSRHESEEHEEEHEEHEEHIHLEEYEEEMRRTQGNHTGSKKTPSRTSGRNPKRKRPKQPSRKKQEVNSRQGISGKQPTKQSKQESSNPKSRDNNSKTANRNNKRIRPSPSSGPGVLVTYGQPILVYHPPPPLTFYDGLGLLHMSLGTSYRETLDLIRTRSSPYGQNAWAIPVCDKFGQPLSHINVGPGQGNLAFVPIRGTNGHADWVYKAKDDLGMTHYIHLRNKQGQLNLVNGVYRGKRTAGILGYDDGGQILIPIHFEKDHFVVDNIVHATDYILL